MPRRVGPRHPRRPCAPVWRRVIAASVLSLLVGCASPHLRVTGQVSQAAQKPAHVTDFGALRTSAGRIAQQRAGSDATFRLVASEPPPTPKTLADGGRPDHGPRDRGT